MPTQPRPQLRALACTKLFMLPDIVHLVHLDLCLIIRLLVSWHHAYIARIHSPASIQPAAAPATHRCIRQKLDPQDEVLSLYNLIAHSSKTKEHAALAMCASAARQCTLRSKQLCASWDSFLRMYIWSQSVISTAAQCPML